LRGEKHKGKPEAGRGGKPTENAMRKSFLFLFLAWAASKERKTVARG
jgi:hypothetical protein